MSENSKRTPSGDSGHGLSENPEAVAQEVEELERRSQTAARLFDVRRIIGGLFVVYGVIVTVAGFFVSEADMKKAQDININLWTGLGMLLLGIVFLVWLRLSPTIPPPAEEGTGEDPDDNSRAEPGS